MQALRELKTIATGCITSHQSHHYLGFAATQWGLFEKETPPRVKPLLYVYGVLLTGIHLMRTGTVEANLVDLNDEFRLPFVPELIDRKIHGAEKGTLETSEAEFHRREYEDLVARLETEGMQSRLTGEAITSDSRTLGPFLCLALLTPRIFKMLVRARSISCCSRSNLWLCY